MSFQPHQYDWAVSVRHRQNRCFRPHHAVPHRLLAQQNPGSMRAEYTPLLKALIFPQAICLAPSRELARQIMSVILLMGKHTQVQTEYAIKDHLPRGATRITAHIVVGTAGTMIDLMKKKVIDVTGVKVFVLDEADNMLDQDGLGDQTLRVKKCVRFSSLVQLFIDVLPACCLRTKSRSSCSPPPSLIMSATLLTSLRRTRTRSSYEEKSSMLTTSNSSTWIVATRSTNMTSSSVCTPY